jgi:hypothetical protein
MPVTLTQWAQTVEGSFTVSESEPTLKDFKVEETASPVKTIVSEAGTTTLKWRAYDIAPSLIAIVKAGTPTAETKWVSPVTTAALNLAIEITTTDGAKISVYKASVFARFDGAITRGDLWQMEVTAKVIDPGSGVAPFEITFPA